MKFVWNGEVAKLTATKNRCFSRRLHHNYSVEIGFNGWLYWEWEKLCLLFLFIRFLIHNFSFHDVWMDLFYRNRLIIKFSLICFLIWNFILMQTIKKNHNVTAESNRNVWILKCGKHNKKSNVLKQHAPTKCRYCVFLLWITSNLLRFAMELRISLWTDVHRHIQLSINSNDYKWRCEIVTIRNSSTCTKGEEAKERDKYICSSHILNFCLEWRKNNRMRFLHHKRGNKITIWNGDTQMFEFNRSQAGDWRLKAAESGS